MSELFTETAYDIAVKYAKGDKTVIDKLIKNVIVGHHIRGDKANELLYIEPKNVNDIVKKIKQDKACIILVKEKVFKLELYFYDEQFDYIADETKDDKQSILQRKKVLKQDKHYKLRVLNMQTYEEKLFDLINECKDKHTIDNVHIYFTDEVKNELKKYLGV